MPHTHAHARHVNLAQHGRESDATHKLALSPGHAPTTRSITRARSRRHISRSRLLQSLRACIASPQYGVADLGVPEVRHCLFRLPGASGSGLDMYSAPRTGTHAGQQSPYHDVRSVRRLVRHYMLAHARVHCQLAKPLREYVQTTDDEMILVWTAADFELYVAFSPLVSKPVAYAACHKLVRRLKKEQPNLFMLHPALK